MSSQDLLELKEIVDRIESKVDLMTTSLKGCQARCHVDNPPKGWRKWLRSLSSMKSLLF